MIGDDVVSDVGGAQSCGMLGFLVRTGKYRSGIKKAWTTPDTQLNLFKRVSEVPVANQPLKLIRTPL